MFYFCKIIIKNKKKITNSWWQVFGTLLKSVGKKYLIKVIIKHIEVFLTYFNQFRYKQNDLITDNYPKYVFIVVYK